MAARVPVRAMRSVALVAAVMVSAGCGGGSAATQPPVTNPTALIAGAATATPLPITISPTAVPGASLAGGAGAGAGGVIVTIEVGSDIGTEERQTYRVRLTDPADETIARALAAGDLDLPRIPNGGLRPGADVNTGYGWHIDPDDFEWAEMVTEDCDGLPSAVGDPDFLSNRFCPWSARVVGLTPS